MSRATACLALLALTLLCCASTAQPTSNLPVAEGVNLPSALSAVDLTFSTDGEKLLVVRHYGSSTPLVTVHNVKGHPNPGRTIFFPLSALDLFGFAPSAEARRDGASAALSLDGNTLVTCTFRTARIWDISKGHKGLKPTPMTLDLPGSTQTAFTKDGKQLLTASVVVLADGAKGREKNVQFEVRLWDAGSGKPIGETGTATVPDRFGPRPPTLRDLVIAPDGASFLTAAGSKSDAKTVQFWDAKTLKRLGEPLPAAGSVYRYGPDGKTLLAVSQSEIALWDIAGRKRICSLPTPEIANYPLSVEYIVRSRPWFAIHPSGTSVLYRKDDQVQWWDLSGEKPVEKLTLKQTGPGPFYWVAISPDGKQAATASGGVPDEVLVWSLETGKPVVRIPHQGTGTVKAMEFSPDGRILATANAGDVQLWSLDIKK